MYDEAVIEYYYQNLKYEKKKKKRELADLSRHFIIIEVFIGIVVCTLIGSNKWIYSIPLIAITFIFLYYWTISYTKKIFLKLDSNYSYKRYKEKVTYNFYDDKLEIMLEPGGINHSESSRNNQSELIRNSQCTCLADRLPTVIQRDR